MKNATIFIILFLGNCFSDDRPLSIAILDLDANGITIEAAKTLTNKLTNEIVKSGRYEVLERNEITNILKEQGFQQTGCVSDKCAVEIGQVIGATHMIVGSVGQVGKTYLLTARIVDVATARIFNTAEVELTGDIDRLLVDGIPDITRKLLKLEATTPIRARPDKTISESMIKFKLEGQLAGDLATLAGAIKQDRVMKNPYYEIDGIWPETGSGADFVARVSFFILNIEKVKVVRTYRFFLEKDWWEKTNEKYEKY